MGHAMVHHKNDEHKMSTSMKARSATHAILGGIGRLWMPFLPFLSTFNSHEQCLASGNHDQ